MSQDKKVSFLPFHAINYFMFDSFRKKVIQSTLEGLQSALPEHRKEIDRLTGKYVQVPGFRNSTKAPIGLRIKPTAQAFEKQPKLVAGILAAWAELNADLRQKVFNLLSTKNWELLPEDADRTKLPGFISYWPQGDDFDTIYNAYMQMFPEGGIEQDEVSLMVVWMSMRLPVDVDKDAEEG